MSERYLADPDDHLMDEQAEDDASDLVRRTGEEMPLALHDQGHRDFREAVPDEAFDPRAPHREPGQSH